MKLTTVAFFGAGYVLGAKAGRERYAQIFEAAQRAGRRMEERRSPAAAGPARSARTGGSGEE